MQTIDILAFFCIIIFLLMFIGRTIQMSAGNKINPLVLGAGKKGLKKFLEYLLIAGLALWTYQSIVITLNISSNIFPQIIAAPLFISSPLRYTGVIFMAAGLVIFFLALVSFGKSWRVGIDKKMPGPLITSGIFRYSRNPIFLFMDIYFFGFAMVYPSPFFLAYSLGTIISIHFQIIQEEAFLLQFYGNEYVRFKKSVRRYL